MNELERDLHRILQDHQHESGLHMIGGQRQLLNRLVKFFEEKKEPGKDLHAERKQEN